MRPWRVTQALVTGSAAGVIGTFSWLGMLAFDTRYAPMTVFGRRGAGAVVPTRRKIIAGVAGGAVVSRRTSTDETTRPSLTRYAHIPL